MFRAVSIVAGLHLRWDGVWQRPQHVLSRLSRRVPVVVIEEPFVIEGEERDEVWRDGNVTILRPVRAPLPDGPYVDTHAIATARSLLGGSAPLVWLYQPLMLGLADAFRGPLVYDCMDDLSAFAFAPKDMQHQERRLLERADIVFCGGRTLYEQRRAFGEKVKLCPSGVDYARFAAARSLEPHPLTHILPSPKYGYAGVIDERLDYDLLAALAQAPARPNLIMIGPVMKIDPAILPRKPNVHFTGKMPYDTLPSILAGLDVALMPFAQNASTRAISPTKTLEYLAAGVPVVSTPVADVVRDYAGVVTIAEGEAFIRGCRSASPSNRGAALARERDWDKVVDHMWADVTSLRGGGS